MANDYSNIALALAAVCQSAKLVQQFAMDGEANELALETSLFSLTQTAPDEILSIYGGDVANLRLGLKTLIEQLEGKGDSKLAQYWLGVMVLGSRLAKNADAKAQLVRRLQYVPTQLTHYPLLSESMIDIFASMYTDIVRPLGRPIIVQGKPIHLEKPAIQMRVRACFLAGVRSAMLWQQLGGSKWQLFFSRRKIVTAAQNIYNSL